MTLDPDGYKTNSKIRLYNSDGSLWLEYSFNEDDKSPRVLPSEFKPFAFHADYFLLVLKCISKDANRFEVVVNEDSGLTKFASVKDQNLRLQIWREHVLSLFSVDFDQTMNPVKRSPSLDSKPMRTGSNLTFHPERISGDWLRITWKSPAGESRAGWIKWRYNGNLLIEPFYFS